ncbi:hypothetical protein GOP47_0021469 [Adiantum capillus-veneris]|uniref:RING-type E3 ubiquitin transferase n=1 Tax=Adiantum capillus-veneris TaxID=13818 RepID=A0A9D4U8E6_ADICA|nr:hypothetical protein GOP47_0021469 [Adiantum capillus-veneris]
MPELLEDAELPTYGDLKIAISVRKGHSGLCTLKWVLANDVPANGMLYLIHVQSPLRWVPNALGGKFPVEQVDPEMVRRYKIHRFLETRKLLDQYKRICDKKKIQTEVIYSESDSVQKEIVSQILKFRITKLIWSDSSQSLLYRALKKDSISAFVAKNSPEFCTIVVMNKGRLRFVKPATQAISFPSSENVSRMSRVSETTLESDDALEGDSRASIEIQDGEISAWSGFVDDISSSQRTSSDFSETSFQWAYSCGKRNNAAYYNPPAGVIIRELPDINNDLLSNRCEPQATLLAEASSSEDELLSCTGMVQLERRQVFDSNIITASISDEIVPQAMPTMHHDYLKDSSSVASDCVVELLQNQLMEARLCAEMAQKEAECQGKKLEAILVAADQKVTEYEKHRFAALRRAKWAMQQARKNTEVTRRDCEDANNRLAEEVTRHKETQRELAMQKRMVDIYAEETVSAKDHAEAEKRRCEEILVKLEDMARKMEAEYQLRKQAEERASQDTCARSTALDSLGKKPQGYYEYSFQELQSATMNFSEENKLEEGAYGTVYKGKLRHTTVAIKVLAQDSPHDCQQFEKELELLSCIRHPHMLMLLGACHERQCIVYEIMENSTLEDRLNCKGGTPPLAWYIRFRVCLEVARALLFLHSLSKPIVYCGLNLSNILLDNHFVSKIRDVGLAGVLFPTYKGSAPVGSLDYTDPNHHHSGNESCDCDVYALGIIMLQLLTGRPAGGVTNLVKEAEKSGKFAEVLDGSAGEWPLEEARKLARISLQCTTVRRERANLEEDIVPVLESIQAVAGEAAAKVVCVRQALSRTRPVIPSVFFCPILREIMDDPYIAADGFTYEHCAIKVWLQANNTSPMTNLRLDHKSLTPNYTMRSAIKEWHDNGLI